MTTRRLCPFLEYADERCASRHTLGGIREAFALCAGDPFSCRVHQELRREQLLREVRRHQRCSA